MGERRLMKGVLKEHVETRGKEADETEAEKRKMVASKQTVISEAILPLLRELSADKVFLPNR